MKGKHERYLAEAGALTSRRAWLPSLLSKKQRSQIDKIAKMIDYDTFAAAGMAVELLQEVNFDDAAKTLNDYVTRKYPDWM